MKSKYQAALVIVWLVGCTQLRTRVECGHRSVYKHGRALDVAESNPSSGQGYVGASTRGCATSRRRSQNSSAVATITTGSMNPDSSIV
jgi:hypothetical protein